MDLRSQLIRLLRSEGKNFRPESWSFILESEDGKTCECDLAFAVEYATAGEEERRAIAPKVTYTSAWMRVRW